MTEPTFQAADTDGQDDENDKYDENDQQQRGDEQDDSRAHRRRRRGGRPQQQENRSDTDSGSSTEDLQRQIDDLVAERDKFKNLSKKHETRAKQNATVAEEKQTVEEKLAALQEQMAARDAADTADKAELAGERLQAKLVRGGLSDDDAAALVGTIDVYRLLDEGKPDPKEIERLSKTLLKIGTRQTPDRDQGRKGGEAPPTMSELIRDAARRNNVVG